MELLALQNCMLKVGCTPMLIKGATTTIRLVSTFCVITMSTCVTIKDTLVYYTLQFAANCNI